MILIVGLGNPGKKYKNTRHNIGFEVVDEFRKTNNFPEFKLSKKFNSLISEDIFDSKKVIIVKPQTFMNNSGKAVKTIFNFQFSWTPSGGLPGGLLINQFSISQFSNKNLIIIHDDIDIPLGKIRISKARSSAGHKGVQSIINELGTKNFTRFRIGIKSVSSIKYQVSSRNTEKFVLQKFSKEERKIVKEIIEKTVGAIELALKQNLEEVMNKYNR